MQIYPETISKTFLFHFPSCSTQKITLTTANFTFMALPKKKGEKGVEMCYKYFKFKPKYFRRP